MRIIYECDTLTASFIFQCDFHSRGTPFRGLFVIAVDLDLEPDFLPVVVLISRIVVGIFEAFRHSRGLSRKSLRFIRVRDTQTHNVRY